MNLSPSRWNLFDRNILYHVEIFGIYFIGYDLWVQWFLSSVIRNMLCIIWYCLMLIWRVYWSNWNYGCYCGSSTCLCLLRVWWDRLIVGFGSDRMIIIGVFYIFDRFFKRSDWCDCWNRSLFFNLLEKKISIDWPFISTYRLMMMTPTVMMMMMMISFSLSFFHLRYIHRWMCLSDFYDYS